MDMDIDDNDFDMFNKSHCVTHYDIAQALSNPHHPEDQVMMEHFSEMANDNKIRGWYSGKIKS